VESWHLAVLNLLAVVTFFKKRSFIVVTLVVAVIAAAAADMSMLATVGSIQSCPTYTGGQLMETTWHCEN
jgi:hypothetical protein